MTENISLSYHLVAGYPAEDCLQQFIGVVEVAGGISRYL